MLIQWNRHLFYSISPQLQSQHDIFRQNAPITEEQKEALVGMMQEYAPEMINIREALDNKIGTQSTYSHLDIVKERLGFIYERLQQPNLAQDQKKAIIVRLLSQIETCAPGFHNQLEGIVASFLTPNSIFDLLYQVRYHLVERIARSLGDEVHLHNRVFSVANRNNYGVLPINESDIYNGRQEITNDFIKSNLSQAFSNDYEILSNVLVNLTEHLHGTLTLRGYHGAVNSDTSLPEKEAMDEVMINLFRAEPLVDELVLAKTRSNTAKNQQYATAEKLAAALDTAIQTGRISCSGNKNLFKNAIITKGDGTTINDLNEADPLRLAFNDHQAMKTAAQQYNAADQNCQSAFDDWFFIRNQEGAFLDVNWPHLKQALWQALRRENIIAITSTELENDLDALMMNNEAVIEEILCNPEGRCKRIVTNLGTAKQISQLFNNFLDYIDPVTRAILLVAFIENSPEANQPYEKFKTINATITNPALQSAWQKHVLPQFFDAIFADSPTFLKFLTTDKFTQCAYGRDLVLEHFRYLDNITLSTLFKLAIADHPNSVAPLTELIGDARSPEQIVTLLQSRLFIRVINDEKLIEKNLSSTFNSLLDLMQKTLTPEHIIGVLLILITKMDDRVVEVLQANDENTNFSAHTVIQRMDTLSLEEIVSVLLQEQKHPFLDKGTTTITEVTEKPKVALLLIDLIKKKLIHEKKDENNNQIVKLLVQISNYEHFFWSKDKKNITALIELMEILSPEAVFNILKNVAEDRGRVLIMSINTSNFPNLINLMRTKLDSEQIFHILKLTDRYSRETALHNILRNSCSRDLDLLVGLMNEKLNPDYIFNILILPRNDKPDHLEMYVLGQLKWDNALTQLMQTKLTVEQILIIMKSNSSIGMAPLMCEVAYKFYAYHTPDYPLIRLMEETFTSEQIVEVLQLVDSNGRTVLRNVERYHNSSAVVTSLIALMQNKLGPQQISDVLTTAELPWFYQTPEHKLLQHLFASNEHALGIIHQFKNFLLNNSNENLSNRLNEAIKQPFTAKIAWEIYDLINAQESPATPPQPILGFSFFPSRLSQIEDLKQNIERVFGQKPMVEAGHKVPALV